MVSSTISAAAFHSYCIASEGLLAARVTWNVETSCLNITFTCAHSLDFTDQNIRRYWHSKAFSDTKTIHTLCRSGFHHSAFDSRLFFVQSLDTFHNVGQASPSGNAVLQVKESRFFCKIQKNQKISWYSPLNFFRKLALALVQKYSRRHY